ncbi:YusW family protein [Sporosarcina siberiensis]|uniref:YusW family protein n=1 Tax=Sporosarcina siberiensis TaxID=1365606 RepID=A0ABW4SEY6_9BACL
MKSKIAHYILLLMITLLICGACGNKNKVTKFPDGTKEKDNEPGEVYGYSEYNMTIDIKELKEAIIVEFKEGQNKTEALYENKIDNIYLHGNKALEKIGPLFENLDFDPTMDDLDMIKKASDVFEINDYTSLKLDIKFKGYDKKQLKFMK